MSIEMPQFEASQAHEHAEAFKDLETKETELLSRTVEGAEQKLKSKTAKLAALLGIATFLAAPEGHAPEHADAHTKIEAAANSSEILTRDERLKNFMASIAAKFSHESAEVVFADADLTRDGSTAQSAETFKGSVPLQAENMIVRGGLLTDLSTIDSSKGSSIDEAARSVMVLNSVAPGYKVEAKGPALHVTGWGTTKEGAVQNALAEAARELATNFSSETALRDDTKDGPKAEFSTSLEEHTSGTFGECFKSYRALAFQTEDHNGTLYYKVHLEAEPGALSKDADDEIVVIKPKG